MLQKQSQRDLQASDTAGEPRAPARRRLFRKYLVVLLALVGVVLLVSDGIQTYFSYQDTRTALGRIETSEAKLAADRISQFMQSILPPITTANDVLRASGAQTAEQRAEEYYQVLRQVEAITELSYVDLTGHEQVRHSRLVPDVLASGVDRSPEPAVRGALPGHPFFGQVYYRNASEPYLTVGVHDSATNGGVTIVEVNLKFVWDVVSQITVGRSGYAYVVDGRGRLIAHPDLSLVLQQTDVSSLPQVKAAARANETAGGDSTPALSAHDLQGRSVLSAYTSVPSLGWTVFVEQPLDEALAPLYASLLRTGVLVLAGLVLAALASLLLARRMVTPIRRLQTGAARIGAGALDETITLHTGDELEALGEEFNRMTARLRTSYTELEQRVVERTGELHEALAALEEKGAELEVVSRHKSEFLAIMSHELRTPLNAVIGFSEVLLRRRHGDLTERQARYVDDILAAGQHLLALINDILDLARIEAGRMDLELETFSLPELLAEGLALLRERAERGGLTLSLHTASAVGVVTADQRKLRQVLLNLLSNAVKFTPEGGAVRVSAELRDEQQMVAIAVQDTGIGIAQEDHERIFEQFRRVTGTPVQEGTGLGLALARRFVELHGGRLTLESAVGEGSTFTVLLPVAGPSAAAMAGPAREGAAVLP